MPIPSSRFSYPLLRRVRGKVSPAEFPHRLIEQRAEAAPDAVAVRFRDVSLGYRELNQRANRLARHLAARGIGREARVAVCVEPSLDIVVALLAIFKVGAVYVPVDPTQPAARLRTILDDTRPKLIVVRDRVTDGPVCENVPTFAVQADTQLLERLSSENPELSVAHDQTAYVYYTSGTTGKPKGVMASYANLASYLRAAQTRYQFTYRDVMPAIARFGFSISMFELMTPLISGGTLVILERDHILDLARMSRTLSEITFFHAGPSLLKSILPFIKRHYSDFGAFSGVRHASSGGDMVPCEVLEALKEVFFNAEVFVIYGCSEISCMGCTYAVPRDAPVRRGCVGKPFDRMSVRVMDLASHRAPVGVEGEVLFAGPGVVKGYLNQPDLTAEKFVEISGQRFYRTGDIGRIAEDGCLELLGRSDFQVKVRGIRVELGEVEHHVRSAPGVRDCAVTARDAPNGEKTLVAYVVMDGCAGRGGNDAASGVSAIRHHVASRLPDYMVPATYVELTALPLNHTMKLDRNALPEPAPEGRSPGAARAVRAAGTATERQLATLWKKLLRVDEVGLGDNFFDLGGDSMLALSLILEMDRQLGVVLEGLEVLRESLEVQAAICDRRLGIAPNKPRTVAPKAACGAAVEAFHSGHERSLYGVLHHDRTSAHQGEAALICAPLGHECMRAQFVLKRLALRLAGQGIPTLRFDYYGCGDSLGESVEATCDRWQRDIEAAHAELRRRTNATRITAVAARLGAMLLWNAVGGFEVARVVLWDPICDGSAYYAEIAEGHRRYLRSERLQSCRGRSNRRGSEELLGLTYSERALHELRALVLRSSPRRRPVPVKWLATSRREQQEARFRTVCGEDDGSRIEVMPFDCDWLDVSRLEDVLPDVGIAKKLAGMVVERP